MEKKATAIIILNYNNYEDTINCMDSIERNNTAYVKIIVVDNGSTRPGTVETLDAHLQKQYGGKYRKANDGEHVGILPYVTFVISKTNDGYARGNNKGLNLAYGDESVSNILVLNNDVLFVEDIIPQLTDRMHKLPDCAIISPILYKKDLNEIDYNCARKNVTPAEVIKENFLHYWFRLCKKRNAYNADRYVLKLGSKPFPDILPIDLPSGSCMLIDKRLFQEIGSFDPYTFLYWEENILYKKIEKLGLRNYLCTSLKCIHLGASSTSSEKSLFIIDCNLKSSRYYMKEYSGCSRATYALFYLSTLFFRLSFILQKSFKRK